MQLSEIVTDICERAGIDAADIDVSALTDDVVGYQVPRQIPARTALETLMAAYSFDAAEEDWKIVFKKRGTASVAALASDDLRAHATGSAAPDLAVETRTQDMELPTHLTLSYESKVRDYEIASQHAVRVDKEAQLQKSASLGLVMEDAAAKKLAEVLLKQLWVGRHRYAISTTYKWLKLAPADVITVNGKQMRIVSVADRGGLLDFACDSEEAGVYDSEAEVDDLTIEAPNIAEDTYLPSMLGLDLPALSEDFGQAGLYFALYGAADDFAGGTIQRSIDGGATYQDVGYVAATASAVVGDCDTTLADGIAGLIDYTAGLTVDLADSEGELASATDADLWGGANLAAVGSVTGGWEIIQFKTVVDNGSNNYTLTGLLRGLYGTERFMATHAASERFVLLDDLTGIDFVGAATSQIGASFLYRVKNASGLVGDATAYDTGDLTLECYPAQGPYSSRNASDDCILAWSRGERYEFAAVDLPDGGDVEMSEISESYSVDVIHPSTGAVVRTLTSTTPTVTYTAAQRTTDSYPAGPITFDIYQVSGVTGRGTVKRVTV